MKKGKIAVMTNMPAAFTFERIIKAGELLNVNIIFIFESKPLVERSHWKTHIDGHYVDQKNRISSLFNILNSENPDILFLAEYNTLSTLVGIIWCKRHNKEYFLGPHEILNYHRNKIIIPLKHLWYKAVAKNALGLMTMGNNAIRRFSEIVDIPITSIPYCFDNSILYQNPVPEVNENEIVFLYSGRLIQFRNPVFTIKIFATIVERNKEKNFKLIISGKGYLYEACISEIKKHKIEHLVDWENDFEDWYDILNLYKRANILLSLQHYSTWGLIIQEAMAAGLAVIATSTIECADNLLIHEYNGFLTNLQFETVLQYIQRYIDNPSLILLHGKRNREVSKLIDIENVSQNLANFVKINSPFIRSNLD